MRKTMPIQSNPGLKPCVRSIPWELLAGDLCAQRCMENHAGQSLERIAERGGVSADEALAIICNMSWGSDFGGEQASHRVLYMMAAMYRRGVAEGGKIAFGASSADEAAKLIRDHISL